MFTYVQKLRIRPVKFNRRLSACLRLPSNNNHLTMASSSLIFLPPLHTSACHRPCKCFPHLYAIFLHLLCMLVVVAGFHILCRVHLHSGRHKNSTEYWQIGLLHLFTKVSNSHSQYFGQNVLFGFDNS